MQKLEWIGEYPHARCGLLVLSFSLSFFFLFYFYLYIYFLFWIPHNPNVISTKSQIGEMQKLERIGEYPHARCGLLVLSFSFSLSFSLSFSFFFSFFFLSFFYLFLYIFIYSGYRITRISYPLKAKLEKCKSSSELENTLTHAVGFTFSLSFFYFFIFFIFYSGYRITRIS